MRGGRPDAKPFARLSGPIDSANSTHTRKRSAGLEGHLALHLVKVRRTVNPGLEGLNLLTRLL
jgi:hypothetical protein